MADRAEEILKVLEAEKQKGIRKQRELSGYGDSADGRAAFWWNVAVVHELHRIQGLLKRRGLAPDKGRKPK